MCSNVFNSYFNVSWKHHEAIEEDWNVFLIQDDHFDTQVKKTIGLFISHFAIEKSLVLEEGTNLLIRSKFAQITLKEYSIDTPYITAEDIFGWDVKDCALQSTKGDAYQIAFKFLLPYQVVKKTDENLKNVDCQNELVKIWEKENKPIYLAVKMDENFMHQAEEDIKTVGLDLEQFVKDHLGPLDACLIETQHICDFWYDQAENCEDSSDFEKYMLHNKTAITTLQKIVSKRHFVLQQKLNQLIELHSSDVAENYPARTAAMVKTLRRIHTLIRKQSVSMAFLIAGANHLQEKEDTSNGLCSLKVLFDYLNDKKNIVILRPKNLISYSRISLKSKFLGDNYVSNRLFLNQT